MIVSCAVHSAEGTIIKFALFRVRSVGSTRFKFQTYPLAGTLIDSDIALGLAWFASLLDYVPPRKMPIYKDNTYMRKAHFDLVVSSSI